MSRMLGTWVLLIAALLGCTNNTDNTPADTTAPGEGSPSVPAVPAATPAAPNTPAIPGMNSAPDAKSAAPDNSFIPPAETPPAGNPIVGDGTTFVPAQPGVAKQGRSLDNESGVLVQPAKSLFAVRERAVFNIQIPQAMQLFEATEGRGPQSHDEFMSKIIAANNINLPQLPAGQRYLYDPAQKELLVERPSN